LAQQSTRTLASRVAAPPSACRRPRSVTGTIGGTSSDQRLERVAVLHPGAMGVTVAASLCRSGRTVVWASAERSAASRARAAAVGLADAGSLAQACRRSDVVVSVCPPDAAVELARAVVATGFDGVYVDANAVAPTTVASIAAIVNERGGQLVDGGIVGPPAERAGTTRLYLSGPRAELVAAMFAAGPLEARVIGDEPGAASALKMCYAAYTKGTAALLLAVVALAEATGVSRALDAEWERSQPDLVRRAGAIAQGTAPKAWRWVGEMGELATTFAEAGLPAGFHEAAGQVFERLAALKCADDVSPDAVTRLLLAGRTSPEGDATEALRPPGGPAAARR
jgi:3-hydroxyisobutyrate dehydrogenase-like beta-hydroxyacid dehydrogenase